jgi:hypothetical protein
VQDIVVSIDSSTIKLGRFGHIKQPYKHVGRGLWGGTAGVLLGDCQYCMDTDKSCKTEARLAGPASALFIILSCYYYYYYYYCVAENLNLFTAVLGHNSVCSDVVSQITGPET